MDIVPSAVSASREKTGFGSSLTTAAYGLFGSLAAGQASTGALPGTVTDEQGQPLAGVQVRIASPSLIGGPSTLMTTSTGRFRFPALPLGSYVLDVERAEDPRRLREEHIRLRRRLDHRTHGGNCGSPALRNRSSSRGPGSRIEARDPGCRAHASAPATSETIPTRRAEHVRLHPGRARHLRRRRLRAAPVTTVSAFGSGANENQFLVDGTNTTCPCNGVARSEPGIDFIEEVRVQSRRGVSGIRQRAGRRHRRHHPAGQRCVPSRVVLNSASPSSLTSQPVRLAVPGTPSGETAYERAPIS